MTPEAYIEQMLGVGASVKLHGQDVVLADEVAISPHDDIEEALSMHPARVTVWRRFRARALKAKARVSDELREIESIRFVHYYKVHEEVERREWAEFYSEESEDKDGFGRRQDAKARITRGDRAKSRWRRNFSDDLVWAYVRSDEDVLAKRRELREASAQVELSEVLCEAMEHRARCLSHLAAIQRDLARAG